MQMAVVYAIVVVAGAPLIGIWRGHKWAKSQGLRLRQDDAAERQTA
ncbi:MAG TPA: hypothetical protein VG714_09260 [Acidobacteriaceae bacterium]|nr:hypothetical protein [Acidobacteriaceae bacterium]